MHLIYFDHLIYLEEMMTDDVEYCVGTEAEFFHRLTYSRRQFNKISIQVIKYDTTISSSALFFESNFDLMLGCCFVAFRHYNISFISSNTLISPVFETNSLKEQFDILGNSLTCFLSES